METKKYLDKVLEKESLAEDSPEIKAMQSEKTNVEKVISDAFSSNPTIRYAGSYKKGTMIRADYDLDIVCYFKHDDDSAGDNLEEIFNNVKVALEKKYHVILNRSSLRLEGENRFNFHIDVVPGRFVNDSESDAFLHQTAGEKNWLKTNLDIHISRIRDSKLIKTIKLAKIWENTYGLNLKTFILELLVIKVLDGLKDDNGLEKCIKTFFEKLSTGIDGMTVEDPANSGNDLSQLFDDSVKNSLSVAAKKAIDLIDNNKWEDLFGPADDLQKSYVTNAFKTGNVAPKTNAMPKPWSNE